MVTFSLHVPELRAGARLPRLLALVAGLFLGAGCPASGDELRPRSDELLFPTGLALSPDESALFISNANAELLYNSGTVLVMDLDGVDELLGPWLADRTIASPQCAADPVRPWILACHEQVAILPDAGVRIGNFSTELSVQELDSGDLRLFVAVRGDPSVTWIDYSTARRELSCVGSPGERFPLCDGDNRLTHLHDDLELPKLVGEPFGVYVDSGNQYAMVTHLAAGAVSLIDAPADGRKPVLVNARTIFAPNPQTGLRAAVGVAGRQPGSEGDLVYVTSRSEPVVQTLYVFRPVDGHPVLVPSDYFALDKLPVSTDSRGIAFNAAGTRAHIVTRSTPSLQVVDTALDPYGVPRNKVLGVIEICTSASNVAVADVGRGDRAYVTCYPDGQVWVADPHALRLDTLLDVGSGPFAVALAPQRKKLFVANYLEHAIAVIDLTPGAPTENRVIMRLGHGRK